MRTILYGFGILGGLGVLSSSVTACTADCSTKDSCGTYIPAEAGASGSAGTSTGGTSGTGDGGSSGDSGGSGRGGNSNASGGRAGNSGISGDSGAGGEIAPDCDPTKSPSEEACLVSNEYAIFVAPTGKDGASGSKAGPVKTIAKAIELAGKTKAVIACDGSYDEQVKLTAGAKLYGGFTCPGSATPWVYEPGKKAKVAPSTKGIALSIASGASSVVIEDFEFDAKDGVDASESSIAAFVSNSTGVALTRVKLVAGKGADGANGTLTKVTGFPTQADLNGNAASGNTAGAFNLKMCPVGGSTTGGAGGNGGPGVLGGGPGSPDFGGGKGGTLGADCAAGGGGAAGANAPPTLPALGAAKLGSITLAGWVGAAGADGSPGSPGQGGGGGTGAATSGGGGGGGAGGCGGAGGTGGKAGGSSIALLLLNASPVLTASELVAANAGKGGNGVAGQDAQPEFGAPGGGSSFGCGGGKGGSGAAGGAGGGAAGGISVGIAFQLMPDVMPPMPDAATTIATGLAGSPGIGGVPGTNDGIAGVKQDLLQVP